MKNIMKLVFCLSLLGAVGSANAGHLFTQASANTPVTLTAGQGITIPQLLMEGGTTGNSNFYLANWNAGDSFRLTIGAFTTVIGYIVGDTTSIDPDDFAFSRALGAIADPRPLPFDWSFAALTGDFTLGGYRIRTAGGTVDGTGSGLVNQDQVIIIDPPTGVPAPAGLALLAIGLLGMRLSQRKKA